MIVCKTFYETIILGLEFTVSFLKNSQNKLEIPLIPNFNLSEKLGIAVTK